MPTYHPSCSVRIQVRLEEGPRVAALNANLRRKGQATAPKDLVPATEAGKQVALARVTTELETLAKQRQFMSSTEYDERRARLAAQRLALQTSGNDDVSRRPGALSGTDPDGLVVVGDIVPMWCRVERNGLNDADTFELGIDFRDLPADPRVIRSAFVEISMGVVPSDEFAAGIAGASVQGGLLSQLERSEDDDSTTSTKFFGFADKWAVDYDDGDSITISGRSVDSLLMTVDLPDETAIDLKRPLVAGVQNLLDTFVETQGMEVVFGNPNRPITTELGPIPDAYTPRAKKPRKGKVNGRVRVADRQRMKLWDHITDVVGASGYVAMVRGLRLYIADPRTFYLGVSSALQIVYGRNVKTLGMERNLGGTVKARTVEIRCYDPDVGKVRWARAPVAAGGRASGLYPEDSPDPSRANEVTPSGVATDAVVVMRVKGVNDQKALERIATNVFQQLGRQEVEGAFSTDDVTSFGGAEGDLLNLYPGDAVELLVATDDSVPNGEKGTAKSNLQELQTMAIARRADYLRSLGWPDDFAEKMAAAQQDVADEQTVFRVSEVGLHWRGDAGDGDGGFELEIGFMNFIIAREESGDAPELSAGGVASAVAGTGSSASQAALRAASASQQTLGGQAEAGNVAPDDFATQGAQRDQETKTAAQGARTR